MATSEPDSSQVGGSREEGLPGDSGSMLEGSHLIGSSKHVLVEVSHSLPLVTSLQPEFQPCFRSDRRLKTQI